MTSEELQAVRAAHWAALRPADLTAETLGPWVCALGFPALPDLGEAAIPLLASELAAMRLAELWLWPGEHHYCHAGLLGYVYVAVGDRRPRTDYRRQADKRQLSWLAAEVFEQLLAADGPLASAQLRDRMGAERTSVLGIERALAELARTLKVLHLGAAGWRPLERALPGLPGWLDRVSKTEAAAALVSQRLEATLCETEEGLAAFFAPLFPRTRIHAALGGLEAAGQLAPDEIDGRRAVRLRGESKHR